MTEVAKYQKFHMCLSITGALRNWTKKYYDGFMLHDDGRPMSLREARAELQRNLDMGRRVLPIGECDNFDYEHGCLGHDMDAATT